jgi:AmiR/NasT family two-component response regulator
MYTGSADLKNVANAFAAGASAYIVKPHTLTDIKSVLQTTLQQEWDKPMQKQYYLDGEFHVFEQGT